MTSSSGSVVASPIPTKKLDKTRVDEVPAWLSETRADFYGVYVGGKKVGHAQMTARLAQPSEVGTYARDVRVEITVKGPAGVTKMIITDARLYGGERPWPLINARFTQSSPLGTEARVLKRTDDGGGKLTYLNNVRAAKTLPPLRENLEAIEGVWATPLTSADVRRATDAILFDWDAERELTFRSTVLSLERLVRSGVALEVATVQGRYLESGLTMHQAVDSNGSILEMTIGQGMVLKLEEEQIATADVSGLDVMASVVPFKTRLSARDTQGPLTFFLTTSVDTALVDAPGQSVKRLALRSGQTGHHWRVDTEVGRTQITDKSSLEAAVRASPMIDSDHPQIRLKATQIIEGLASPREHAMALSRFVYKTLTKRLATHVPLASLVLAQGVGDCTEHTWLFVALCRAVGIPARPAYGLMYLDGDSPAFGYHAWAEVAIEGQWIAVDPTWNQFPADATHIKLGTKLTEVAMQLGGIAFTEPTP